MDDKTEDERITVADAGVFHIWGVAEDKERGLVEQVFAEISPDFYENNCEPTFCGDDEMDEDAEGYDDRINDGDVMTYLRTEVLLEAVADAVFKVTKERQVEQINRIARENIDFKPAPNLSRAKLGEYAPITTEDLDCKPTPDPRRQIQLGDGITADTTGKTETRYRCRRCKQLVDMEAKKCGCAVSPSPWEPLP